MRLRHRNGAGLVIYCRAAKRRLGYGWMSQEAAADSAGYVSLLVKTPLVVGCANVWAVFTPRSGMPTDTACYNTIESDIGAAIDLYIGTTIDLNIGALKTGTLGIRPAEGLYSGRAQVVPFRTRKPVSASGAKHRPGALLGGWGTGLLA